MQQLLGGVEAVSVSASSIATAIQSEHAVDAAAEGTAAEAAAAAAAAAPPQGPVGGAVEEWARREGQVDRARGWVERQVWG